jgi:lipid A 3-O-deacylase
MVVPRSACGRIGVATWVVAGLLAWGESSWGEGFRLESAGGQGGFSANESGREFHQAQAFVAWNLPWSWDLGKEWGLQSRLDLAAGWLGDNGHDAAIGSAGPSLVLGRKRLPLSLEGGVHPTLLSDYEFGLKDFGTYVQFTTHVGLNWDFARHWSVGYRFEHMSNAGLAAPNPGLNLHVFGLSYRF